VGPILLIAFPIRRNVAGIADGQEMEVRGASERIADFEGGGLLAFDAVGLMELTIWMLERSPISRTMCKASSKFPRKAITVAPSIMAWVSLPMAMAPLGRSTTHLMPARAA